MQVISTSRESLATQVYRALLEAIVIGELAPGSLHSVGKLAERIGISRSPVREALITLADQGMVIFERNRGVRIQQTTAHDLEEVFSLRLLLEVPAAYRAAQQMQPDEVQRLTEALGTVEAFAAAPTVRAQQEMDFGFHRVILDAAGNRRLAAVVDNLWTHQKLRGVSTAGKTRDLADIHRDHERIHRCIHNGDAHGAAVAMRDHLLTTGGLLLAQETTDWEEASALELPWMEVYAALGGPSDHDPAL